jgi:hypothetical protein
MNDNKNLPAFPISCGVNETGIYSLLDARVGSDCVGLTKREQIAAMALQGLLANPDYNCPSRPKDIVTTMNTAKAAIHYADALLNELSTTQQ